jgi:hypothetical protein
MKTTMPRTRRGRPQKFGRPARAVTITLPVDTVVTLQAIDPDLGCAIVELVGRTEDRRRRPAVKLAHYGRRSIIVVRPVPALKRIPGVELVPSGDAARAFIALTERMTIATFELRVQDALDTPSLDRSGRAVLTGLADILREARRSGRLALSERTIIVVEPRRAASPRPGH